MDINIRDAQQKILKVFSKTTKSFALAGGTALELCYLKHRFSLDLDFFSAGYDLSEVNDLVRAFRRHTPYKVRLESDFVAPGRARVRFYTVVIKGSHRPLKIDFVEDVLLSNPRLKTVKGIRVYDARDIFLQKLAAVGGTITETDGVGRPVMGGRNEGRDVFDIYMLSKKIIPLHIFLKQVPARFQRGMVHWYRTFSRQELKLVLLDLDIYDRKFDAKKMILYLENEIKQFIKKVIEP